MKRSSNLLLFVFLCAFVPLSSFAATTEFRVLLDTDNNASTGCSVAVPGGSFAGVDQVLITTVDSTATGATVTSVSRQVCSAGTLGASVPVNAPTPYNVGLNGSSGNSLVESVLPLDTLGTPAPGQIRVAFVATTGASNDAITQTPSAASLLWPPSMDLPRRHATGPGMEPQLITLDGDGHDWGGIPPFVPGGAGGPSAPKFINVYLFADTTNLWFRFDAKLGGTAPVAGDDIYSVRQGKTLNVNAPGVLANDADPNGATLTPSVVTNPQHGTLALDPSGSFIYVNNGSSAPVDTFTYKDTAGGTTSNTANVTINVTPDHKPTAGADSYSVPHAGTLNVPAPGVLTNDSDFDGDHITAVLATGPQHGTLTLHANGSFTYTHDGSNTLQDTFTYRADDGVLQSTPALVTITIAPDTPATAVNDSYTVAEGGTLAVPVPGLFANDSDPDTPQNQWTAQVVTGPAHGVLTLATGGAFTYVHDGSETTSDSFTYTINDGIQAGNTATVSITVTPVNDAPVAVTDTYNTLLEDTPFSVTAATGVLANDTDADTPHASLTAVLVSGPAHALSFALNPNGSFNYTPAANYNGSDSFSYKANDGALDSNTVTVSLSITPVNDVPSYASGGAVSVNEDSGAYSAGWATVISAGPADEAGQALNFIISNNNNALFSIQPSLSPAGLLTFTPAANANGVATVNVQLHDNGGTANGGVDTTAIVPFTITVVAVDDAPVNTVPGAQSIVEDTTFTFTGGNAITVNDIDLLAGNLTVTLGATNGTLTLGSTAGLTVSGNGTSSVQATGTIANLNAGLNNTVYAPNANYSGADSVTVNTNDNGNTGSGGPLATNSSIAFTITGVNDAPAITRPATATTNEDTPFTFSGGNLVSIADIDAASGSLSLTLSATNGTLTLSGTTGLTVSGNGTSSITASGNLIDLNNALNGLVYAPSLNYNGADTLNIGINDNGNTGSGGPLTDSKSVAITVNAVNDAPVAVADGYSVNEDTPLNVLAASGVLANDSDVDTPAGSLTAVLNVGPANASSFTLNADGSFSYTPNANFSGSDSFTYHVNDGALDSNVVTVTITVNPVNDAPVITRPANASTNEDTLLNFGAGISIADIDAASGSLSLTLSVSNGVLNLSGTTGLTVSGNGTASINASGTLANLNAALNGMTYSPSANYSGADTLNIGINDNGNTGSGGPLADAQSTAITVNAINDPPVNGVPGTQSVNEDATLTFSSGGGNAITVSDIDAAPGNLQVTLSSANGTITLGSTAGLTVSGNGTGSVQAAGTIAALNAGLDGTTFTPTANYSGATSVDVSTSDLGNTGAGGAQVDNDSITVNVSAVNDAPVITRPATATTNEDTPFTFTAGNVISIADVDAASGSLSLTLSVTNGTLTLAGTTGLTVSGDGTNSINASGNLTDLNAALNGLVYASSANYNGADTLNIGINDNGNTGSGGPLADAKSVAITVVAVDDSPVAVADGYSTTEDTPLVVPAGTGVLANDTDVDTAHVLLTAVLNVGPTNASSFTLNSDGSFSYTPNANFSGSDSFTYHANDGNSDSNIVTVSITVTGVNDAPVITRPAAIIANEDQTFIFNGGNLVSISDVDAGAGSETVTLSVGNGTLTLAGTTGLSFTVGDGTADANMTFSGTLANLNAALNGMTYLGNADYFGPDTLNIGVNDNGNSGSGGAQSDAKSTSITVTSVDDAPVAVANGYLTSEDTPLVIAAASGVLANDTDIDTPHASLTAVLNVGPANASSFTLNADGSFSYTPNANFSGSDSFTYHANDGSLDSNIVTVNLTITAINDAPVITRPAAIIANEDQTFTFNGGNVVSISDVDAGAGSETVTLSVGNGTLTLAGTTGLAFTVGDGTADANMTFSGTLTNINAALNGMTYLGNADYFGPDTLNIGVNDNGSSGSGGAQSDAKSTSIAITSIDDAPVAVADGYSTSEDTPLVVAAASGVLANDTDIDTAHASLTAVLNVGPANASSFTLNADGSFSYTPNANFSGSDSFTYHANDGSLDSNIVTVNLTITAVNDAPVITRPAAIIANEDQTFTFNGGNVVSISDVDAGAGSEAVTLSVTNGTLTLAGTTGLSFSVGDGTADASMAFSGTLANINAALNGMTYLTNANYAGSDTLSIGVNDNGNTGAGGAQADAKTTSIAVTAVNDAPVNSVPGTQTINEDATLTFTGATAITVSDVDAGGADVTVTLSSANGTITLGSTAGLTTVTGNGTASVAATGPIATINTDLNNTVFTPTANFNGSTSVGVSTNDNGNTGTGGAQTTNSSITVNVTAVDDAPVITRPATATTNEDTPFTFNGGNVISIADLDAAAGSLTVTLGATNGVLTLSGTTGLTVSGNGTTSITASGTLTNLNNALNGMTYTPGLNYNGGDTLSIGVNDNSNTGTGGPQTDAKSVAITVNAVNDAPVATADAYGTNEDVPLVVNALTGVLANDTDVDTPHASLTAVLNVGPTNASAFTLNADGSFSYTPNANFSGSDSFTYHANDGSLNSGIVTVTITITAVNDAPVNSMPATPTMNQDSFTTLSGAGAIQISDVDAGANPVQVQLTGGNGTMTLSGIAGLSFTVGDGTADATMTFTGTIANINTALNGMTFTSSPAFFGTATINIITNDQGFTGTGGAQQDNDTLNITVLQVNQPPVNTVPAAQVVNEDTVLTFSTGNTNAISIADPDAGANPVKVTLAVTQGTLTLSGTAGLAFTVGDGTSDATMTFTGTIASINTALQGMSYLGNLNYNGADVLTITTNDQGNTGPGGAMQDIDTVNITVNAVNDAPVAVADSGYSVFKYTASSNTSLSVTAAAGVLANDTDVDTPHASLTAIQVTGPLHAQSFTLNADGSFTYVPTTNYVGADSFSYKANDGSLDSNTVTASITVLNHAPTGGGDSFTGVGNTALEVATVATAPDANPRVHLAGNLLTNDSDADGDTISAVVETVPSTNAGSATISANGSFTFTPVANVTSDTFTYHVTDGTDITPVTVTITLTNKVWYAKNSVVGPGTGTSGDPFKTLAAAAGASAVNEFIYVFAGDGTTGSQNAGITLKNGQSLIGADSALVVGTNTLTTAGGGKPKITNATAASDAITLADGNTIKGLEASGATRDGISSVVTHAGFIADNLLVQTNVNVGVDLISMTGTVTITNSTISTVGNQALTVNNGTAAVTVDNTNTIDGGTGTAVSVLNRPVAAGAIAIGATLSAGRIQVLTNLSGTISFTGTQTLSTTTNNAITLTTNAGATINFSGTLNVTTTTGIAFRASGGGTLNVSGTANLTTGAAGNGLTLTGMTVGGTGVTFNSVNTTGATTAIALTTVAGTVSVNGGTLTNGTTGISLQGPATSLSLANVTIVGPTIGITNTTDFGTLTIGAAVNVSAAQALNLTTGAISGTFANVTSTGDTNGVNLNAVTGTWGAAAGSLAGATGATFNVTGGGGGTITWAGTISQANGAAVVAIAGGNSNTINFNGNVTASGTSTGININTNTGTYSFAGTTNSITGSGGGILINAQTGGSVTFNSGTTINTVAVSPIASFAVTNSSANVTYSGTITNNNNNGILLNIATYSTGTLTMNGTSLTGNVNGINGVISTLSNITGTVVINNLSLTSGNNNFNNTLLNISGVNTGGSMTFNHLVLSANGTGHTGKGLVAVGNGTLTITATGGASSIDASSTALDLSGQTLGVSTLATVNSSGGVNGIKLTNVAGGLMTLTGGTIAGNTGAAFLVSGGAGSVSYGGTITQNTAAQRAVDIQSKTGGTITLSGAIGSTGGAGVFLNSNTGATINISGAMTLSTGATAAFTATGGGTVNVTAATNNITTTSGTGINWNGVAGTSTETFNNVNSTTGGAVSITSAGATNFTFNDVTSTTGKAVGVDTVTGAYIFHAINANGAVDGVTVNAATGSFTVNGTATTAGTGGTIQACTHNGLKFTTANNITLKNMNLTGNGTAETVAGGSAGCSNDFSASNNLSCVANLNLQTVTGATLTNLSVTNSGQEGINGNNVTTFSLKNSTVTGNGNTSSENGLNFQGMFGTCDVTDTTVQNNAQVQIRIENLVNGALDFTLKKQALATMNVGYTTAQLVLPSQQGLFINKLGTATLALTVDGITAINNFGAGVSVNNQGSGGMTGVIQNCTFTTNNVGIIIQSAGAASLGTSNASPFLIQNNNGFTNNQVQAILVSTAAASTGSIFAKIDSNQIGTTGNACNIAGGFNNCDGIDVRRFSTNPFSVTVSNNTVQRVAGTSIAAISDKSGASAFKIINNNISVPYFDVNNTGAIAISSVGGSSAGGSICMQISGNTIDAGSATFGWDPNGAAAPVNTQVKNSAVVTVPGLGTTTDAGVIAYLPTVNTIANNVNGIKAYAKSNFPTPGSWSGGAACSTP